MRGDLLTSPPSKMFTLALKHPPTRPHAHAQEWKHILGPHAKSISKMEVQKNCCFMNSLFAGLMKIRKYLRESFISAISNAKRQYFMTYFNLIYVFSLHGKFLILSAPLWAYTVRLEFPFVRNNCSCFNKNNCAVVSWMLPWVKRRRDRWERVWREGERLFFHTKSLWWVYMVPLGHQETYIFFSPHSPAIWRPLPDMGLGLLSLACVCFSWLLCSVLLRRCKVIGSPCIAC